MLAIIKTGGKQYVVKPGDKLEVEKLDTKAGEEISFSEVLLVEKNKKTDIGAPMVSGATVKAKVLSHGKDDKVIIFKYKPKKRFKRKVGHRQPFTQIEIVSIES
jgi:large subunit ribosomal protein L21